MGIREALTGAGAKAAGKRPWFFTDPDVERVMTITMAVAGEVAVLRQRLDTVERLLDEKGSITRSDIEEYTPDKNAADERGLWMEEYISRILRVMQQEREALETMNDPASHEVASDLDKED